MIRLASLRHSPISLIKDINTFKRTLVKCVPVVQSFHCLLGGISANKRVYAPIAALLTSAHKRSVAAPTPGSTTPPRSSPPRKHKKPAPKSPAKQGLQGPYEPAWRVNPRRWERPIATAHIGETCKDARGIRTCVVVHKRSLCP
jgi:hypothetical protein